MEKMTVPKILRQNPVQSWKDFKKGLGELTPKDHLMAKQAGHFWAVLGASAAALTMFVQAPYMDSVSGTVRLLGFGTLVSAIGWLQFVEWRKETQKLSNIKGFDEMLKNRLEGKKDGNRIELDS